MLLDVLKKRQRELGLNDVQFAAKLQIPRATWTNTKLGYKRIGERVITAALHAFPDLGPEIIIFLRENAPTGNEKEPNVA